MVMDKLLNLNFKLLLKKLVKSLIQQNMQFNN